MGAIAIDMAAVGMSAAMGAGVGVVGASILGLTYWELPLLFVGLVVGAYFGVVGFDMPSF